jgi:hypothetical protein
MRSGKVTGSGFAVRNNEHLVKAKTKNATSAFYLQYPSLLGNRATSALRRVTLKAYSSMLLQAITRQIKHLIC